MSGLNQEKANENTGVKRAWGLPAFLLASGLVLLACIVQSEYLLVPVWLEPAARLVYRCAYWIVLPFRVLVYPFLPQVKHHWSLTHTAVTCMGTPFFLFGLWKAAIFCRRLLKRSPARRARPSPGALTRRQFLAKTGSGVLSGTAGGFALYAGFLEPHSLRVREYEARIADLPESLDGLRIVHVSDTHYGPFTPLAYLRDAVRRANQLEGDLVVLTGDYVHRSPKAIGPGIGIFGELKSRFGAVAVLGNHEHWEGAEACRAAFNRIGAPLLDNRHMYLTPSGISADPDHGNSICLAGVGDYWEDEVSFDKALDGVRADAPRLVLSHNPETAELVGSQRVDLMFSGHTHGGQVRLPFIGAPFVPSGHGGKYCGGLCYGPHCPVVVSRGVGLAGLPVRFRVPPELCLVTLKQA